MAGKTASEQSDTELYRMNEKTGRLLSYVGAVFGTIGIGLGYGLMAESLTLALGVFVAATIVLLASGVNMVVWMRHGSEDA